jgi:hypothetical protein
MRDIEFQIERVLERYGDAVSVEGRCIKGPICRGDEFNSIAVMQRIYREDGTVGVAYRDTNPVKFVVEYINLWFPHASQIEEAYHGILRISGTGVEVIGEHRVLSGVI